VADPPVGGVLDRLQGLSQESRHYQRRQSLGDVSQHDYRFQAMHHHVPHSRVFGMNFRVTTDSADKQMGAGSSAQGFMRNVLCAKELVVTVVHAQCIGLSSISARLDGFEQGQCSNWHMVVRCYSSGDRHTGCTSPSPPSGWQGLVGGGVV
jgi:hypothetical protein